MEEEYWNRFMKTGKITDYLYYKGMAIETSATDCMNGSMIVADKYDLDCREGEAIGKSDYSDWHGACGSTYR